MATWTRIVTSIKQRFGRSTTVCLAVLGTISFDQALSAADRPHNLVLAEGPLEIRVRYWNDAHRASETVQADLFQLTTNRVTFWPKYTKAGERTHPVVFDAAQGAVMEITSDKPKHSWLYDRQTKSFQGDVLRPSDIDMRPVEALPKDELRFLYFAYADLFERMKDHLSSDGQEPLQLIRERAEQLARRIQDGKLELGQPDERSVAVLYASVQSTVEAVEALKTKRQAAHAAIKKELEEKLTGLAGARQDAGSKRQEADDVAHTAVGLFFLKEPVDDSMDTAALRSGAFERFRLLETRRRERKALQQMREEVRNSDQKSYQAYLDWFRDAEEFIRKGRETYRTVGALRLGLESPTVLARRDEHMEALASKNDTESLVQLQRTETPYDRIGNVKNPFEEMQLLVGASQVTPADLDKQVAKLNALAHEGAQVVRLIPPGAVYNRERATILIQSARWANHAALLASNGRSLSQNYDPNAQYALRLLEKVAEFQLVDVAGEYRCQRVYALAASGRLAEAADQLLAMGDQPDRHHVFLWDAARLFAAKAAAVKQDNEQKACDRNEPPSICTRPSRPAFTISTRYAKIATCAASSTTRTSKSW
jgi:hypothetical protein